MLEVSVPVGSFTQYGVRSSPVEFDWRQAGRTLMPRWGAGASLRRAKLADLSAGLYRGCRIISEIPTSNPLPPAPRRAVPSLATFGRLLVNKYLFYINTNILYSLPFRLKKVILFLYACEY